MKLDDKGEKQVVARDRALFQPTQLSRVQEEEEYADYFDTDGLVKQFGKDAAAEIRRQRRMEKWYPQGMTVEDQLRDMDYLTAEDGSTEALAYERRALQMECDTDEERQAFLDGLDRAIEEAQIDDLEIEDEIMPDVLKEYYSDGSNDEDEERAKTPFDMSDPIHGFNPNQKAFGEW